MTHNIVHLGGHCKKFNEIVTDLCRNRTIKKSKYHEWFFLAGFECYTNSIINIYYSSIFLLTPSVKGSILPCL